MSDILHDLSEAALIKAIEDNLLAFHPYFLNWPRSEGGTSPRLLWSITDIPFPMFNNVLGARLKPEEADIEIKAVIARGRSRQVPILWFTGPSTTPADLGQFLVAHGFVREEDSPGLAADLIKLPAEPAALPNFTFTTVNNTQSMKTWCDTAVAGYGMPELVGPAFLDWFCHYSLSPLAPLRHYIGWLNGRAVATASLLLAAGVAGIYNVATLPEARGHGIGTAMTLTPLLEARAEGYRVGVLQSSAMGLHLYRRLGFQEYCTIGSYVWQVESPAET
jgi:ribosomal protein S18 acetylase RimI-like enzyme